MMGEGDVVMAPGMTVRADAVEPRLEYDILVHDRRGALCKAVDLWLIDGWLCQGGVCYGEGKWCQAVVRPVAVAE